MCAGGTWYTTYTHVPYYLTSHGRSLALESLDYTVFDFTDQQLVAVEVNGTELVARIIPGKMMALIEMHYLLAVCVCACVHRWNTVGAGRILHSVCWSHEAPSRVDYQWDYPWAAGWD